MLAPTHGQVAVGVHDQCPFAVDLLDDETALGVGRAIGDECADVDVLEFGDDPVGTRSMGREQLARSSSVDP